MRSRGAAFDGPDRSGRIRCIVYSGYQIYEEWESTLRICERLKPHTKIHTHMIGNNAHMGFFCIRCEVKRWRQR